MIIAHTVNRRFASGIMQLLCGERMMELPLRAESLERCQVGDPNCTSFRKLFAIRRHLRLANAQVQLRANLL